MIRSIIFDMGGVIIDYDPALFARRMSQNPEEARILEDAVFHCDEWFHLDEGTITLEAFDDALKARLEGELQEKAIYLLHHWYEDLPVFSGMERLMKHLHEKGYPLYLLSNAGQQFHTYRWKIPAFRYLDGIALSSDLKLLKPGPEIYQWLLSTYGLKAEECMFIDDSPKNAAGADAVGIHGYDYSHGTLKKLCQDLAELGILETEEIEGLL